MDVFARLQLGFGAFSIRCVPERSILQFGVGQPDKEHCAPRFIAMAAKAGRLSDAAGSDRYMQRHASLLVCFFCGTQDRRAIAPNTSSFCQSILDAMVSKSNSRRDINV